MSNQSQSFWFSPKGLAALGLIGAASYFLLVEHSEHLFGLLPYLILLLCPLMHIFMHGGHESDSSQDISQSGLKDGRKEHEHRHHH